MTKEERFSLFIQEVDSWLQRFGIFDWDIGYELTAIGQAEASTSFCSEAHAAKFTLNSNPTEDNDADDVKRSALHEVLELVLADLSTAYRRAYETEDEKHDAVEQARHAVIHRIQHALGGAALAKRVYYR